MPTLQFKGKTFVQNHHLAVPYHQLLPQEDKSLTDKVSLNDNLIVHGDNLLALKALLPTYAGKVKCIYIDPPYNTGKEKWVYSDNVSGPIIKQWIGKVVGREGEDLVRHDKWLCMMTPRLKLLKELLAIEGVIFISISDTELHNLISMLSEIFGKDNHLATLVWENKEGGGSSDSSHFRIKHEYIVCFAKNVDEAIVHGVDISNRDRYSYSDEYEDVRGPHYYQKLGMSSIQYSESLDYPIEAPDGTKITPSDNANGEKACWRWSREKLAWGIENDYVVIKKNRDGVWTVYTKQYLKADNEGNEIDRSQRPMGVINDYSSTQATKAMKDVFTESELLFDYPKPVNLIKHLLSRVVESDKDALILDSFAGSGTTAQAVLELNKDDDGNRKFILVEMEDYADSITAERVRRVIKGVPKAKNKLVKKGLGGSFSYFELGDAIEMESLLSGKSLPAFTDLARYLFYTATGEEFKADSVDEKTGFIGSTSDYDVYVYYKPDLNYLKTTALTLDEARRLRNETGNKPLLVFAPTKYIEQQTLDELNITFCQLPFEIYRMKK